MFGFLKAIRQAAAHASRLFRRSSPRAVLMSASVLLVLIGILDYLTSVEMSLAAFYWLPVAMVTWQVGPRVGYGFAVVAVAFQVGTDISGGVAHTHPFFLGWDVAMRLLSLSIFVSLLAKARQLYGQAKKAMQLEVALESGRAAYRELKDLSHVIAHNLYAPVRAMTSYSQLVLEGHSGQLDSEGCMYLNRLHESGETMRRLIDALLQLIDFSGGELRRETVDLSAIAGRIASELQRKNPSRAVNLEIQPGVTAEGDRRLLEVSLQCLLDNAWKFTSRQSTARIEFGELRQQGCRTYFVRDDGVGFDMTHVQKLFLPFHSAHRAGEFDGVGIGLSIAERLIRRHGGRIWADGAERKGATFYFTLSS